MRKIMTGSVLAAATLVSLVVRADKFDGVVSGRGDAEPAGYVPVLVANGELAMTVDRSFGVRARQIPQYSQGVFLEGRRVSHPRRELLPQGRWYKKVSVDGKDPGVPTAWRQALDARTGLVTCTLDYPCGLVLTGETFIPRAENTIALRLSATSKATAPLKLTLGVGYDAPKHDRIVGTWRTEPNRRVWKYRSYGHRILDGETAILGADADVLLAPGATVTRDFFITFSDTMRRHRGCRGDYDALRATHVANLAAFGAESSVALPDRDLQRMWEMAHYHLNLNATPWSFPVGILDSHWQGLYFGFDEMYMHQGLVASGHFGLARHEPDYRFATIGPALMRNRYGGTGRFTKYGARWFWESLEDGQSDGTVPGEWMDHIFHMATIAKCAWQQWLYGRDRTWFAQKGFPIVYESARHYRYNWIYEDSNGDTYVGKCCDLERLGPSRDHPFMTTCGVIYTLRVAADACDLLGTNRVEAAEFRDCAKRLEASLPVRDGRYITCLNEPQESMATLAGFFPFPIFPPENKLQREAVTHFIAEGKASGNMYPTGSKICSWYAGTMSAASSWMEDRVEPARWLKEAFSVSGAFGEYFEINEPGAVYHPWFATAAGNCLYALCQMLVCDREGQAHLAFTVPTAWKDYAFRLPSQAGVTVDFAVRGGRLEKLELTPRAGVTGEIRLVVRPEILKGVTALPPRVRKVSGTGDRVVLAYSLQ